MNWYAKTQMGEIDIDEIANPSNPRRTGDARLAGELFDTVYQHGGPVGGRLIQQGINDTLIEARESPIPADTIPQEIGVDGVLWEQTKGAIEAILNQGFGEALRRNIDMRRAEHNRRQSHPGPESPNDHYRRGKFN